MIVEALRMPEALTDYWQFHTVGCFVSSGKQMQAEFLLSLGQI